VTQESEADAPLLAIAIERGGVLVDAHDQADAVLQVLVGELPRLPTRKSARPGTSGGGLGLVSSMSAGAAPLSVDASAGSVWIAA